MLTLKLDGKYHPNANGNQIHTHSVLIKERGISYQQKKNVHTHTIINSQIFKIVSQIHAVAG